MGKKNKKHATASEHTLTDVQTNKKRKHLNSDVSYAGVNEPVHGRRNKNNVASDVKQDSEVEIEQTNEIDKHLNNADVNLENLPSKIKRKKRDKNISKTNDTMPKNKKIVFKEDGQVDNNPLETKHENKKQFLSGEEAAVTEEEIDRFCDELNEEDNAQFDDWVKLIEEKLKPNRKNKPT